MSNYGPRRDTRREGRKIAPMVDKARETNERAVPDSEKPVIRSIMAENVFGPKIKKEKK